jgi:hypothetical protein
MEAPRRHEQKDDAAMARKPNYQFERLDRERVKAQKTAEKAALKREAKEREERERTGGVNPEGSE